VVVAGSLALGDAAAEDMWEASSCYGCLTDKLTNEKLESKLSPISTLVAPPVSGAARATSAVGTN
jgi:hypothetical protein